MISPLDQFKIVPIFSLSFYNFDFSLTNFFLISFLGFFITKKLILISKDSNKQSFFLVPNLWQLIFEKLFKIVGELLTDNIVLRSDKYFPFVTFIFMFILTNNLIGLIPFSFTTTSHITLTFLMSFSIFVALNIIGFQKHKINIFSMFLPSNTNVLLALLLIPIELISYIAKPISLGVRLFINLMAGHSLLKVIVGFSWNMLLKENLKSLFFIFPLIVLTVLIGLEIGVALIQAYVFVTLTSIYLNDIETLH